jgi:hypothetical protein
MGEYVLHIHAVMNELDKGNCAQMIARDVNNPPFILEFKIVQRWKNAPHLIRRPELTFAKHPEQVFQRLSLVGM